MTRKDYIAIAKVLNHYYHNSHLVVSESAVVIARDLAEVFTADNPRFDSDRFMSAIKETP